MSGPFTSPLLNAIVSASPTAPDAAPANAKELAHHKKNGKGFINPWDSFLDREPYEIFIMMAKYD